MSGTGNVAQNTAYLTDRGDDSPIIALDKRLFDLKSDKILPKHKLLRLFNSDSVKRLVNHCNLLKVRDGQILYKEGDSTYTRSYIIVVGKIALKGFMGPQDKLGTIGIVEGGDTLGEEGVFEIATATRKETALAEGDSYVLEITRENFDKLKVSLENSPNKLDWFTLNNHMKK